MAIIIKYILKSILEKKFRTFIIVFSVTLSTALFFASSALSGTLAVMYENQIKMQTGGTDLLIQADRNSPSPYFRVQQEPIPGVALIVGDISIGGIYKIPSEKAQSSRVQSETLHLRGFDLEELQQFNPLHFNKHAVGRDFSGNHIVISSIFADKYGLDVGDSIDLEISGAPRRLIIWGVAHPTGIFQDNPQSSTTAALMPKDTIASLLNARGNVSTAYVMLEEGADVEQAKDDLSKLYARYTVRQTFSADELQEFLQLMVMPLFLMTIIVLFISIFIIYSTFKVITVERLPVIGTFRSIGATKRITDIILTGESLTYGILGGLFGNFLGIGILYLITGVMSANPYNGQMDVDIQYHGGHLLGGLVLAIIVALISSWIPITKASKIPIKDLVLNKLENRVKKKKWKLITGLVVLPLSMLLPRITPHSIALIINIFCVFMSSIALIMLIPYITKGFLKIFEGFYASLFGNEGILAIKNLNGNKNILNNISLLAIGISALLMINTISHSVGVEVLNAYGDWKFDIMTSINQADRNTEQMLRSVEGVEGTYGAFSTSESIQVVGTSYRFWYLEGIDINKYRDYSIFRLEEPEDVDAVFRQLDEGRNILLATMGKERLGVEVGDTITLQMKRGDRDYQVIGFYDSLMSNGNGALISEKYYKMDMDQIHYTNIYVKTYQDPDEVLQSIQDRFRRRGVWGDTIANMEQRNMDSNNQLFIILKAFSIVAMLIGIFGIFNNYMISFMERRHAIAILRSVGLSKKQTLKMIMVEALTGGCIGGMVGTLGSLLILSIMPYVLRAMGLPIPLHYVGIFFINAIIGGIIIALLASISPAAKTSKLNIIEALKYE